MAAILPIRAWRYNSELSKSIESLISPLFDVVSDKQRKALYTNPFNSIHLSVPQPPNAADRAAYDVQQWKSKAVIKQDPLPAIYVYYQYFSLAGSARSYCRKGFICHIRATDWDERIILRHENTIPKAVNDRVELLQKTELHASATHGMYTDPEFQLEKLMDEAIQNPLYETEDYQGARDVLAVIHDAKAIGRFIAVLENKSVILADGHHRYEASLIHKQKMDSENALHSGDGAYNFHLMYLTNTEGEGIVILPTHRLIKDLPNFDPQEILRKLENHFSVKPVEDMDTLPETIAGKPWTFGIMFKDEAFKIRLRSESFPQLKWPFPEEVKKLDLTVMHYFIIEKILGISGKEQRQSEHLAYDRSFSDCLTKVSQQQAQMAIITNEVTIEEVKKICHSNYTMPQKSTYFYPKVVEGFLFTSIRQAEFELPFYAPF